jgi:hypothetical protein
VLATGLVFCYLVPDVSNVAYLYACNNISGRTYDPAPRDFPHQEAVLEAAAGLCSCFRVTVRSLHRGPHVSVMPAGELAHLYNTISVLSHLQCHHIFYSWLVAELDVGVWLSAAYVQQGPGLHIKSLRL